MYFDNLISVNCFTIVKQSYRINYSYSYRYKLPIGNL